MMACFMTMNRIVLVKQVPDVSNIPETAWDKKKGTLKRALLDNVLNPLDLQALTFAARIARRAPGGRTVYLTMGPPQAREALLDCLSRAPGDAVLLTDPAFAGADTAATAYALALAVRRIRKEIFAGDDHFLVVSGMQSVDGDTAQVPPQVAEELGIEHIAYAQDFAFAPDLRVRRIGPLGAETVRPLAFPVLVTVAGGLEADYRSFELARRSRAARILAWDAASIGADPARIGLKGSHTVVQRIFSPNESRSRKCVLLRDGRELVARLKVRYRQGPARDRGPAGPAYSLAGRTPSCRGEIWVYVELEREAIKPVSLELLAKARELAAPLGEKVAAVAAGASVAGLAGDLAAAGADRIYALEHPLLETFLPLPFKTAVAALVRERRPQIMLFGATPLGRELAPRVAYAAGSGLTADCTGLKIGDDEQGRRSRTAVLLQTRPALGGNIMATILTRDSPCQMATVRPGVMKPGPGDPSRRAEIVRSVPGLEPALLRTEVLAVEERPASRSIRDAAILVAGGRGLRTKADFDGLLRPLAGACAACFGARTEIAGSRMAVEEGFLPAERQVGQTGQTVQPRLYFALGTSGAVQHLSGMMNSEIIVAVNTDPQARIFGVADFGIVGDVRTVAPEIARALEAGS